MKRTSEEAEDDVGIGTELEAGAEPDHNHTSPADTHTAAAADQDDTEAAAFAFDPCASAFASAVGEEGIVRASADWDSAAGHPNYFQRAEQPKPEQDTLRIPGV